MLTKPLAILPASSLPRLPHSPSPLVPLIAARLYQPHKIHRMRRHQKIYLHTYYLQQFN